MPAYTLSDRGTWLSFALHATRRESGAGKGSTPYPRQCRSRSTKNKTAIGSRGWINAALTRRYRARRARSSRCGTSDKCKFVGSATFQILLINLSCESVWSIIADRGP